MYVMCVQQQYSRMPERGWYSGKKKDATTNPPTTCYSNTVHPYSRVAVSYTHRRNNLPTHDVLLQQYRSTAADPLAQTVMLCRTLGFPFVDDSPPFRGASDPPPGGPFNTPARRAGHGCPFFRRDHRGLLCGAGMAPTRDRGRPSGARESQLFFGHVVTKMFSKIHVDITATEEQ